jgi:hypothetical protein
MFLVCIHADIFAAGHTGRSFSGGVEFARKTYSKRGTLYIVSNERNIVTNSCGRAVEERP